MISLAFMIKKFNIKLSLILSGYGVTFFNCRKCPHVNRASPRDAKRPWNNCNGRSQHQLQLATRAVQPSGRDELRPAVAFSKTCLKHGSV